MSFGKSFSKHVKSDPIIQYCTRLTVKLSPLELELQEATLSQAERAGMLGAPEILQLGKNFIQLIGAKRALDIGTFTGCSALAWAFALPPNGEVITMDVDHTNLNKIGKPIINKNPDVAEKIKFVLGSAIETLDKLIKNGESGKFDFAFIDADKIPYPEYYQKSMELLRSGGVIMVDNALRGGKVAIEPDHDDSVRAIAACNELISNDSASNNALISMGDGLHLAFKK